MAFCFRCHASEQQRTACESCHSAPHEDRGRCVDCHKNHHHDDSKATLCAKCHLPTHFVPSTFNHPKTNCQRCHQPPHPDRGACSRCHDQYSWASHFSHPTALAGVHGSFPCERCHTSGFNAPGRSCVSCHGSNHGGLTTCASCHSMSAWLPSTFHHPSAGEHSSGSFACSACHPNGAFSGVYRSCDGGEPPSGD
jgi:hypothetical protein